MADYQTEKARQRAEFARKEEQRMKRLEAHDKRQRANQAKRDAEAKARCAAKATETRDAVQGVQAATQARREAEVWPWN